MVKQGLARGRMAYRRIAFEYLDPVCSVCGYADTRVLEVHHKDGDHSNNVLSNLDILCPTHHAEYDKGIRVYGIDNERRKLYTRPLLITLIS